MRALRYLIVVIFALSLIGLLSWTFRASLISFVISTQIKSSNLKELEYELESIDFSGARLGFVSLELTNDNQTLSIQAENLTLGYSVKSLDQIDLNKLEIEQLAVASRTSAQAEVSELNINATLTELAAIISQQIPIREVLIERLYYSDETRNPTRNHPLEVYGLSEHGSTALSLLHNYNKIEILILGHTLNTTLKDRDDHSILSAELILDSGETIDNVSVSGRISADFEKLNNWWQTIAGNEFESVTGNVEINFSGGLFQGNWAVEFSGHADSLSVGTMASDNSRFSANLTAPNELDASPYAISINPDSNIVLENIRLDGLVIKDFSLSPVGHIELSSDQAVLKLADNSKASFSEFSAPELLLKHAQLIPHLSLILDKNQTVLELESGLVVDAQSVEMGSLVFHSPAIFLDTQSEFRYPSDQNNASWVMNGGSWSIPKLDLYTPDLRLSGSGAKLTLDSASSDYFATSFVVGSLDVHQDEDIINIRSIHGSASQNQDVLSASGGLFLGELVPGLDYSMELDFENQSGQYNIDSRDTIAIAEQKDLINGLISNWVPVMTLSQGDVKINATGRWGKSSQLTHEVKFNANGVSGIYGEVLFSGLDISGPVFYPPFENSDSAQINIRRIEYGADVENIQITLRLLPADMGIANSQSGAHGSVDTRRFPIIAVSNLSGEVMGSNFVSEPFNFDPNANKNHLDIGLTNLDIEKVVSMQQIDGLNATGKLDGKLPVDIVSNGVNIELGQFWNQSEGGTIQYLVDEDQAKALSNPLTDTLIKALEEFHYDLLTASANFRPNGDLTINFHIEGKSPLLDSDRPVHLNINSEQNVLSLLKSLKYAEDLNSGLDESIRQNFLDSDQTDQIIEAN